MQVPSIEIVSGGQTGVDRAALDAAFELGVPCGGWCPRRRLAEDGRIPERYPLKELDVGAYAARTKQNVLDSDGTLIVFFDQMEGGTALTTRYCARYNKPCELIDGAEVLLQRAAERIQRFVTTRAIRVLNVAGPRASTEPRAYCYTYAVLTAFLRQFKIST